MVDNIDNIKNRIKDFHPVPLDKADPDHMVASLLVPAEIAMTKFDAGSPTQVTYCVIRSSAYNCLLVVLGSRFKDTVDGLCGGDNTKCPSDFALDADNTEQFATSVSETSNTKPPSIISTFFGNWFGGGDSPGSNKSATNKPIDAKLSNSISNNTHSVFKTVNPNEDNILLKHIKAAYATTEVCMLFCQNLSYLSNEIRTTHNNNNNSTPSLISDLLSPSSVNSNVSCPKDLIWTCAYSATGVKHSYWNTEFCIHYYNLFVLSLQLSFMQLHYHRSSEYFEYDGWLSNPNRSSHTNVATKLKQTMNELKRTKGGSSKSAVPLNSDEESYYNSSNSDEDESVFSRYEEESVSEMAKFESSQFGGGDDEDDDDDEDSSWKPTKDSYLYSYTRICKTHLQFILNNWNRGFSSLVVDGVIPSESVFKQIYSPLLDLLEVDYRIFHTMLPLFSDEPGTVLKVLNECFLPSIPDGKTNQRENIPFGLKKRFYSLKQHIDYAIVLSKTISSAFFHPPEQELLANVEQYLRCMYIKSSYTIQVAKYIAQSQYIYYALALAFEMNIQKRYVKDQFSLLHLYGQVEILFNDPCFVLFLVGNERVNCDIIPPRFIDEVVRKGDKKAVFDLERDYSGKNIRQAIYDKRETSLRLFNNGDAAVSADFIQKTTTSSDSIKVVRQVSNHVTYTEKSNKKVAFPGELYDRDLRFLIWSNRMIGQFNPMLIKKLCEIMYHIKFMKDDILEFNKHEKEDEVVANLILTADKAAAKFNKTFWNNTKLAKRCEYTPTNAQTYQPSKAAQEMVERILTKIFKSTGEISK